MKLKFVVLLIAFALQIVVFGQSSKLKEEQVQAIHKLINVIKTGNKAKIADLIEYPLRREYPLKDVKSRSEFIQRFSEILDEELVRRITKSTIEDWSQVGWRGIMLGNGTIWISDKGRITTVNYQGPKEKQLLLSAIQNDKNKLPKSLRNFDKPVYLINTKNYRIRIDEKSEGNYRYTSWKRMHARKEPDLILDKGVIEFLGSGGSHTITFKNNDYTYIISVNAIRCEHDPEMTIEIQKGNSKILEESGRIKRN